MTDLLTVVKTVKPTILVGTSTDPCAFTQEVVEAMCANTERPVIFPISNPTKKLEATAEQVIEWSDGKAFAATGVPSGTVHYQGVDYEIGQANNALIYPGLGLGMLASEASLLTDEMIGAKKTFLERYGRLKNNQVRLFSHHSNMWQMFQSKSLKLSLKWHKNKV